MMYFWECIAGLVLGSVMVLAGVLVTDVVQCRREERRWEAAEQDYDDGRYTDGIG